MFLLVDLILEFLDEIITEYGIPKFASDEDLCFKNLHEELFDQ